MKRNTIIVSLMNLRSILILAWLVLSTLVYGIVCLIVRILSERISRYIAVLWCRHLGWLSGVKVVSRGLERLDRKKNYVFIANHQSYFDIVVLYYALPYALSFIARKNLFYIPVWGWSIWAIGHIPVDRSNPRKAKKTFEKAVKTIKRKHRSIFGFPEGTRSRTGEVGEFKLGLFSLALKAGIDIVPIAIHGARDILPRGSFMIRPGTVYFTVDDPIEISAYDHSMKFTLAEDVRKRIIRLVEEEKKRPIQAG
ncbi:MAG: 1-acyl-sn-glycerol-3-phosphate acyltransferase [Spirochaetales bacterium]|nr:1-acyl-sn-glycerol-3-phosphate acyltransferase [Spirochaetales bacterium]